MLRPEIDTDERRLHAVPDVPQRPRRERVAAWLLTFLLDHDRLGWWLLQYVLAFAVMVTICRGEHLGTGETLFALFGVGWFVHLFHEHERKHHRDHH